MVSLRPRAQSERGCRRTVSRGRRRCWRRSATAAAAGGGLVCDGGCGGLLLHYGVRRRHGVTKGGQGSLPPSHGLVFPARGGGGGACGGVCACSCVAWCSRPRRGGWGSLTLSPPGESLARTRRLLVD